MSQFIQQIQTLVWPVLQRVWLYKPLKHLTTSWHLSWPTSCMPPSATILLLALTLQPETSSVAGIQDFLGGIFTERHALVQHQRTGAPGQRISQDLTGPNFSHCMSVFKILTLSLAALLRILSLELSLVQLPLVLLLCWVYPTTVGCLEKCEDVWHPLLEYQYQLSSEKGIQASFF